MEEKKSIAVALNYLQHCSAGVTIISRSGIQAPRWIFSWHGDELLFDIELIFWLKWKCFCHVLILYLLSAGIAWAWLQQVQKWYLKGKDHTRTKEILSCLFMAVVFKTIFFWLARVCWPLLCLFRPFLYFREMSGFELRELSKQAVTLPT